MIEFDVAGAARVCGGALVGAGGNRIRRVVIDSREVEAGDLFVALPGTRTHGHAHVADAFERGAVAAVVEPAAPQLAERFADRAQIRVKYPREALADLAAAHRKTLSCPVIAVTGSNGKSSTREIISAALGSLGPVVQSPRSFNNDLGVPLTLLSADADTAALVVELGTNNRGEIRHLAGIARPDIGVVTNVAAAHLDGLSTLDGVAQEKGALAEVLPPEGMLVLNAEDLRVLRMSERTRARVATFGLGEGCGSVWGCDASRTARGIAVWVYGKMRMFLPVLGVHNARNAMAAVAVGLTLGVRPDDMRRGFRRVKLPEMRLQRRQRRGVVQILDCYNANPASLDVALTELDARSAGRRRVLVLGDMRELGRESERIHRECGRDLASRVDVLWCVGGDAHAAYEGARAAGMHPEQAFWSPDVETAVREPAVSLDTSDMVLFKASRALRLERLADALAKRPRRSTAKSATGEARPAAADRAAPRSLRKVG